MDPSFQPFSRDKWVDEHANNRDDVVKAITDAKLSTRYRSSGLFATSPADFRHSNVVRSEGVPGGQYPFSMTNNGLNIKLPLARNRPVVIYLKKESRKDRDRLYLTGQGELSEQYTRFVVHDARYATNVETTPEDIYVKAVYLPPQTEFSTFRQNSSRYVFHLSITLSASTEPRYSVLEADHNPKFIEFDPPVHGRQALNALPDESFVAALRLGYEDRPTDQSIIVVGREQSKSNLWCTVLDYTPQSPTISTFLKDLTQSPTWTSLQSDPKKFDEDVVQLTSGYIISASIRPGARRQSARTVAPPAQVILDHQYLIVKVTTPATQHVDPSPASKKSTWFGLRA
ncbi:hypothetical protein GALMADRAFT_215472 [Galerina marginata CBS 339.88]|uniref:Uncharacterized protein n=1 Tax=Galerina marginata (strain CBS 339.88) TaxID=685588 RepID=A0A067SQ34_GALM3|nr:hypothetical protein GALMADRAFT_215472 [Galerina marginata CBS 339.88]